MISLEGAASVSLEAGTAYTDAGATATDNIDGSISSSIVTVNPVDIDTVGTYTVTYNVSDAAGNAATAVTRSVEVVEPVLTGYFTDSAVEGLTYTTDTQSGVTDLNGAFTYQAGETVVFSIGDFMLGESATAAPKMTPLDLIPDSLLPTTRNELSPLLRNKAINTAEVIAFRKLSNMLTFLQALDYDKDASNGITIADGMGIVLEGVSIDFAAELTEFKEAIPLRRVMSAAVTQNLISSGFIKEPGQALNHFYQAQEIEHSFKARASASFDSDANGEANEIITFTYDDNGNRLTYSFDSDANGDADSITTYTYDDNGNRLTYSRDSNANGEPNEITTYTYDDNGNWLTYGVDTDANGEPNSITTSTYDADGNLLERDLVSYRDDSEAGGTVDTVETYTYDANGIRLTGSYCETTGGVFCQAETYTYDDNGNMLTKSYYTDTTGEPDGEPNSINTYTYDADGNQLTYIRDANANGEADQIYTYAYDTDGNRLTWSKDTDANGNANEIKTYTYDADGNRLTYSSDTDANGKPNSIQTYTYDDNGNRLTFSLDANANGEPNSINTYTHDDNGNQLTFSRDINANGEADQIYTSTYEGSSIGQVVMSLIDDDG